MDPIHLDKARMTKTPLTLLGWRRVWGTKSWGVGGRNCSFFYWLMTKTLSSASTGLSTETNYRVDGYHQLWWTPHPWSHPDLHVWMHHVRALETWNLNTSWLSSTVKHICVKGSSTLDNLQCSNARFFRGSYTGLEICPDLEKIVSWSCVLRPEKVECRVFF